jgi:tetratricopeptide (TPR) repeat protein
LAYGLWFAGFAELRDENYAEAKRFAEISLKLSTEIDNTFGSAWAFLSLGGLATHNGDFAEAKNFFTRCLQMANKLNYIGLSNIAIKYLGELALLTHDIADAQEYLTQSLRIAYDLGLDRDIANHLYDFASLQAAQNKLEGGVELISLLLQQPASHQARLVGDRIRDHAEALLDDPETNFPKRYI